MRYSIKEASRLTGIKVRTIRSWVKEQKIKAMKNPDSARWEIPQNEIDRLINEKGAGVYHADEC